MKRICEFCHRPFPHKLTVSRRAYLTVKFCSVTCRTNAQRAVSQAGGPR